MIVKIFSLTDKEAFGSGFIVGNHLFTAAHIFFNGNTIESYESFYLVIENVKFEFKNVTQILFEYRHISEYSGKESNFYDIAIFDISNLKIIPSKLEFDNQPLVLNQEVISKGFSDFGKSYDEFNAKVKFPLFSFMGVGTNGGTGKFTNCSKIDTVVKPGNSGGPVFFQNKVVGMVVTSNDDGFEINKGTSIIKSEYILEKLGQSHLSNYNKGNENL
jgi:hypothetical protein